MRPASSHPPRLLEVLYSFNVGGSELLGLELAQQLARQGVEVMCTALQGNSGPLLEACERHGIEVVDLGLPRTGMLSRNGISLDLVRRLKSLRVDTLHLQHFLGLNKLGLAARLAGVPRIVVTEHSVRDASQSLAGRLRIRLNWRLADAIATVHPEIRDYLATNLGVDERRLAVVPVAVELDRWHRQDRRARREQMGYADEFVFAFVGRFAAVKNVPGLVSAFLDMNPDASAPMKLVLVGDGEDRRECERIAGSHEAGDRVRFMGELSDARPVLAAADGFVMNSRTEGTPRAMLEAMAMGLACAGPSVGGIPSMLESRGWVFRANDSSDLKRTLHSMATHRGECEEAGARAREYVVHNYNSERIRDRYMGILFP